MDSIPIENTDAWRVNSHGNGTAYTFTRKSDGATGFVQGDDATQWRADYEAMHIAYIDPKSVWFGCGWNRCLAELVNDYIRDE